MLKSFADFAVAHRNAELPAPVYHAACRALADWYAATVAGADMAPARIMRDELVRPMDSAGATLIPRGPRVEPRMAALINGTASHTAELDDIFRDGLYHPGSPTVAAALALAEARHSDGEQLLRAIAIGYEISSRIAVAMQPSHYTFWHTTGTVGTLGAAAAGAEILGLDVDRFAHALATATTTAAGLQQAFRSNAMSKPLHAGHAAEAGMTGALLAAGGFTGALDILEGDAGFGAAMSQDPDWEGAIEKLGKSWAVGQATVKSHACCGHTFAAVDAALELRVRGVDASDIERIEVETYATALRVAGRTDPQTEFEAKFSLGYCVAAALQFGSVRLAAFEPSALNNPSLRDLVSRVSATVSPELDADFPGRRRAIVTLVMKDGSSVSEHRHTRKGDPDDPVTDEELQQKFHELASPALGPQNADELFRRLWNIQDSDDVAVVLASEPTG